MSYRTLWFYSLFHVALAQTAEHRCLRCIVAVQIARYGGMAQHVNRSVDLHGQYVGSMTYQVSLAVPIGMPRASRNNQRQGECGWDVMGRLR